MKTNLSIAASSHPVAVTDTHLRILLADDNARFRVITAEWLHHEPDLEVIGEAQNGQEAIELARQLLPDIVLMDMQMPILSGLAATRYVHLALPAIPVLALTAQDNLEFVRAFLHAGAGGYLLKTSAGDQWAHAIRQVCQGEPFLDPAAIAALEAAEIRDLLRMAKNNLSLVKTNRAQLVAQEEGNV